MRPPLKLSEAYLFEASENYTILHFHDGTSLMVSYTLKRFEELLASNTAFVRIHKSYMVNKQYIAEVMPTNVLLHTGLLLPLARRRSVCSCD